MTLRQLHIFAHAAMQSQRRHMNSSFQQTLQNIVSVPGTLEKQISFDV